MKISKSNKEVKQTSKQQKVQQICQPAADREAEVKRVLSLNLTWVIPGWGYNERVEHLPMKPLN